MRKIKVVVLLVQQLQHGFTKNAKVSPNLTVAHIGPTFQSYYLCQFGKHCGRLIYTSSEGGCYYLGKFNLLYTTEEFNRNITSLFASI